MKGYKSKNLNENGKREIVFNSREGYADLPVTVPCGKCIGCRLERSRQWAIRCEKEISLHEKNCFITLTYATENLPPNGSLDVTHFQLFMKRLRKAHGPGIRFFHCGEYGDLRGRPHYHAILFNFDFGDKKLWKTQNGNPTYTSAELSRLWPSGFSLVAAATFSSAAYVARYILKKLTGLQAQKYHHHPITGEILDSPRKPEYATMSRQHGIGKRWFDKYKDEVYPSDFVISNGRQMKPPKYYDLQYEIEESDEYRLVRMARKLSAKKRIGDDTPERLAVRERVQKAKARQLPRKIE